MVTVEEATSIVLENSYVPKAVSVPVTDAIGRTLAETLRADRDMPPFDRVTMDGIAIRFDEWERGRREFTIEDVQAAGQPQKRLHDDANAIEVMTGAVLPEGTDTVIKYEEIALGQDKAVVKSEEVKRRQNVHTQGMDSKAGEVLLEPGVVISAAEVALLASIGLSNVDVLSYPKAAIISSGDELIEIEATPEPHQVRRSNSYAIQAAMREMRWNGMQFHLADNREFVKASLEAILADHDVLIVSGGISKGKFDFVPDALEEVGVKKLFHHVSQRPGKPFWFGKKKDKTVFALPGNPISTFMCFHRYVKPWLMQSFGHSYLPLMGILGEDFAFEPKLTHFLQVRVRNEGGKLMAFPVPGGGSGDFANLKDVDAFMELPMEKNQFRAGEAYPLIPFR